MCQAFNIGAALALRTFLRERNAVLRMNDGRTIPPDRITIVQAKSPSPLHGVHIGFIYTCAERGIGFDKPKMMAGSHMWIQLDEEYNLDFMCQQFGLGEVVDAPPSSSTKPEQQKSGSTRGSKPKHTTRFEPAAQLRTRTDGSMRPWALLEQVGSDKSVLRPPAWRADAATMSSLEREGERGCGLSGCGACGARVFGTAEAPRGPREGEGDPISLLVHAPELWEEGWNTKARGPGREARHGWAESCVPAVEGVFAGVAEGAVPGVAKLDTTTPPPASQPERTTPTTDRSPHKTLTHHRIITYRSQSRTAVHQSSKPHLTLQLSSLRHNSVTASRGPGDEEISIASASIFCSSCLCPASTFVYSFS